MKFTDLFEMPTFINKELPVADVKVNVMSVATLDREYTLLGQTDDGDMKIVAALNKNRKSAIIGQAVIRDDAIKAVHVVCTITFHKYNKADAKVNLGVAADALQVDTVVATDSTRGAGYGYMLYKFLLNAGHTVVSDNIQYIGGKELWKKIVRRAARDSHTVHILQNGKYLAGADGKPIAYDGSNIPDEVIWSEVKKSEQHYYTLLVAKNN